MPEGLAASTAHVHRAGRRQLIRLAPGRHNPPPQPEVQMDEQRWQGLEFLCQPVEAGPMVKVAVANRPLKKGLSTLRQAQGERKNAMKSGRGSAHAELVEAWGGVFQRAAKADRLYR